MQYFLRSDSEFIYSEETSNDVRSSIKKRGSLHDDFPAPTQWIPLSICGAQKSIQKYLQVVHGSLDTLPIVVLAKQDTIIGWLTTTKDKGSFTIALTDCSGTVSFNDPVLAEVQPLCEIVCLWWESSSAGEYDCQRVWLASGQENCPGNNGIKTKQKRQVDWEGLEDHGIHLSHVNQHPFGTFQIFVRERKYYNCHRGMRKG